MNIKSLLKRSAIILAVIPLLSFINLVGSDSSLLARGGGMRHEEEGRNRTEMNRRGGEQHPEENRDAAAARGFARGAEYGSNANQGSGGAVYVAPQEPVQYIPPNSQQNPPPQNP